MDARSPILLVGNSVRYLAQSARDAGIPVLGVDAFADLDTQRACQILRRAEGLAPRALLNAVQALDLHDSISWTYGAGFESAPELLASLSRNNRNLFGNDAKVMQLLAEPVRFFALLAELDIAHPDTSLQRPSNPARWLFKLAASAGGLGVRWAEDSGDESSGPGFYQAFVDGPLCSLVFAANGSDIQVIGFNRLIAEDPVAGDFRFAGAIGGLAFSETQQARMILAAQRLTRALRLRGVNGLDFVLRQGEPLLLELNARPPATLELYEAALPQGGLVCHLEACDGRLPLELQQVIPPTGMRVVYGSRDLQFGAIDWPAWARDRSAEGGIFNAGSPMCTVHAGGGDAQVVERLLEQRADAVRCLINGFSEEAA